jgi:acylphosphatase
VDGKKLMSSIEVIVRGRVQGVGFRYFLLRLANDYQIDGEVWNRRDGGVELIACHESSAVLELFTSEIENGPGRVDSVVPSPYSFPVAAGFRITDTR